MRQTGGGGLERAAASGPRRGAAFPGAFLVVATLALAVALEVAVRLTYRVRNALVDEIPLPYVFGQVYGPVPPWIDGLRFLEDDERLMWCNRPSVQRRYVDIFSPVQTAEDRFFILHRFWPHLPESLAENPMWTVSTNSDGFRDREFTRSKDAGTIRILCLGDSWTFGANVSRPDTYPYLLEQSLRRRHPQRRLEVFNLGVLAYSSLQVEELLRARAWDLRPDHIVVGVAMNDASVAKFHDRDLVGKAGAVSRPARRQPWTSWLRFSQLARLATYIGEIRRFEPLTPGEHLVEAADPGQGTPYLIPGASGMLDYGRLAGRSRVSLPEYEQSLRRIVEAARGAGVGSTLLYNDLAPNSPYLTVLQRLSRELRVPLVNAQALVSRAREKMEQDLEAELALRPDAGVGPAEGSRVASAKEVGVTFRVYVPSRPVGDAIHIAAAHADLGNAVPNVVRLYDDGSHGDQRAHDRVWSYRTTLAPGTRIFYMYTNSGRPKRWEGLDVPDIRAFVVPEVGGVRESYRPIDTFGQVYMQADSWHTNGLGYALIAEAVSDVLSEALSGNGIAAQARGPHGPRD